MLEFIKKTRDVDEDSLLLEGICFCSLGRYEKAIELAERVIGMNPANDNAVYNKSIALEKQGRRAEALIAMKQAC